MYKDMIKKQETGKRWRENNKDRLKANQNRFRTKNPTYIRDYMRRWREDNKEQWGKYKWAYNLKYAYNLTGEEYFNILKEQECKCPICGKELNTNRKKSPIDHDRITGKVRGILCVNCNTALGKFNDNIILLEGAINYLKRNQNVGNERI
jgi:hypothetical protein